MISLLANATADGPGPERDFAQDNITLREIKTLQLWGTFDGGTVTIEVSPDGTQWNPVTDGEFLVAAVKDIKISASKIRASVSGAGGSTDVNAAIT